MPANETRPNMKIGPLDIRWRQRARRESTIVLRDTVDDPSSNNSEMIATMCEGFRHVRERTDEQLLYFGRIFSVVLFIEYKIEQILIRFDPLINQKMLGEKISVYKAFLKELKRIEADYPVDFAFQFPKHEKSKQALFELNNIRRNYAHRVDFDYLRRESIKNIADFNRTERSDLWEAIPDNLPDKIYVIGQLYIFGFCFSHLTTELITCQKIEQTPYSKARTASSEHVTSCERETR